MTKTNTSADAAPQDERALFEAWAQTRYGLASMRLYGQRMDDGAYVVTDMNNLWAAWQARAALPAQAVAPVPKGFALVPVRLTRAMSEVMDEEGWQWHELLAVADAITEQEYAELEAPAQDVAPTLTRFFDALDYATSLDRPGSPRGRAEQRAAWQEVHRIRAELLTLPEDVAPTKQIRTNAAGDRPRARRFPSGPLRAHCPPLGHSAAPLRRD